MRTFVFAFAFLLVAGSSLVKAGGFFLSDRGVRPMGRGFAWVAGANDPQAIWYNPAGLSWSKKQLLMDTSFVFFRASYTRMDSGGNMLSPVSLNAAPLPLPMLAYSYPVGDWTLGIGIHAPHGTRMIWPRGVREDGSICDYYSSSGGGCAPAPQRYSLLSLRGTAFAYVTPAVAYRPIAALSFGLGVPIMAGRFVGEVAVNACDGFLCTHPEDSDWDGIARFDLAPMINPGMNLGMTLELDIVRVGMSFAWWPRAIRGDVDLQMSLPSASLFNGARVEGRRAEIEVDIPFLFRLGIELRPARHVRVETAVVWERWSMQDRIVIKPHDVWIRNLTTLGEYQVGPIEIPRNMKDVWSVRLGGSYSFWQERLFVSMGINFENSSFSDAYLTPLTLDTQKWITTFGIGVQIKEGVWLDMSYAHIFLRDRNIEHSQVSAPNPIRPSRDPNAYSNEGGAVHIGNGRYQMEADMVGVGLRWQHK